jgi:mono/diheme cytochrome c family protein
VAEGRVVYQRACASCHGDRGQGIADFPALAGGEGTLESKTPVQTVGSFWPYATTVWDYIHRAMPYQRPGTLDTREVYAVTAYILFLNHIVPANAELSDKTLARIRMPNRNGFIPDPRPDVKQSLRGTALTLKDASRKSGN